ncbi:MAG: DUF2855 family protein [Sphingomonadales bacterium]|jgi:hypothetical protein
MIELTLQRSDITAVEIHQHEPALQPGEVLVKVDEFALTANNVTYAAHGVDFGYWNFWPAPEGQGIVPVWGFGTVVDSRCPDVANGLKLFGYWPMASHAVLLPGRVSARGFDDMAAHRQGLAAFYNRYQPASAEWGASALQCLFRPLYATSFLLDAMLQASPADTLLLSSASSKTALGLAELAHRRVRVVGLTSAGNADFCRKTGYYHDVLVYGEEATTQGNRLAFVDFSGNGTVRHAVHAGLGDRLIESHVVGDTHWQQGNSNALPGVPAQLFFAPTVAEARVAEWGPAGFDQRLLGAWRHFAGSLGWLETVTVNGAPAVAAAWAALARGSINPAQGMIASLG